MDILLGRYALLTTLFLSPTKCAEKWRSLRNCSPEELGQQIKRSVGKDFPGIQELMADVEDALAKIGINGEHYIVKGDEGKFVSLFGIFGIPIQRYTFVRLQQMIVETWEGVCQPLMP